MRTFCLLAITGAALLSSAHAAEPFGPPPTFKRIVRIADSAPSPFATPEQRALQAKSGRPASAGPNISGVLEAIQKAGVTGWIAGSPNRPGIVCIGSENFRVGDEITVPKGTETTPLIAGHKVVVSDVSSTRFTVVVEITNSPLGTPAFAPVSLPIDLKQ